LTLSDIGYLFDTNVLSEVNRRQPNARVLAFVRGISNEDAFISALTVGELRRGAVLRRRTDVDHADRLDAWIASIEADYGPRILPVDLPTARLWGELASDRPRPAVDALIAATAMVHDLTLVTRNTRDFADTGVALVNPWE
jgi:predicted nucleic acid-binding protein